MDEPEVLFFLEFGERKITFLFFYDKIVKKRERKKEDEEDKVIAFETSVLQPLFSTPLKYCNSAFQSFLSTN
jgi:hypothetical protein